VKNNIVIDITDVVERQKKSKAYNIKLATLIIGILVLCALTIARLYDLPFELFIGGAVVILIGAVFVYNLPGAQDRKFLKPFIEKTQEQLKAAGFHYKDSARNKDLKPWFSPSSRYLYGKGLTITKDPAKGIDARKLSFMTDRNETVSLSVERLSTSGRILLQVVELDEHGNVVDHEDQAPIAGFGFSSDLFENEANNAPLLPPVAPAASFDTPVQPAAQRPTPILPPELPKK
jgi:hypothetical protein